MEHILDILIKGIIIGLSISIPLGPIGILCIQRTLNKGRKFGIITGLGATLSDLMYSVVSMFCLSFVLDFIEHRKLIIQIIGGIIVVLFGIWIYRSNPRAQPLPEDKKSSHPMLADFFTSTALTLSNPLIVFVLIGLFSQFDFVKPDYSIFEYAFAIFSILIGATIWWFALTGLVNTMKNRINVRGLKIINRLTGTIIILIGALSWLFY